MKATRRNNSCVLFMRNYDNNNNNNNNKYNNNNNKYTMRTTTATTVGKLADIMKKYNEEETCKPTTTRKRGGNLYKNYRVTVLFFTLLSLLFSGFFTILLGDVAEAAIVFTPTNVAQLSLYQTAQLRFDSNTLVGDPPITTGDSFYFIKDASSSTETSCTTSGSSINDNKFTVRALGNSGLIGYSTIVVKSTIFTVGSSYSICYITGGKAYAIQRNTDGNKIRKTLNSSLYFSATVGTRAIPSKLLVWPSIYDSYLMEPSLPSGALESVELTVTEKLQEGRAINQGLGDSYSMFLIPCDENNNNDNINNMCGGLNNLPLKCSQRPSNKISLSSLRGVGTASVTGSFTVPYVPSAHGYAVCIPYCYDAFVGCGRGDVEVSYTIMSGRTAPSVIKPVIIFSEANPFVYVLNPTSPQAREEGKMILSGTGLTERDEVRVIRSGSVCNSVSSSLLTNLELGALQWVDDSQVSISFTAPELITEPMRGIVCYRHAASALWSAVHKDPNTLTADFVINVLQPTKFNVVPENPFIGQSLKLFFTGTGLDASKDEAFLTTSIDCSEVRGLDTLFKCPLTGGNAPSCAVMIDPPSNQGLTLYVCYKKEGRVNYARVNGTVVTQNRNPTFTLSPYPLYAGQKGVMTLSGEGLSLVDTINFITGGTVCGEGNTVKTLSIANGKEITAGKSYQYDVVGTGNQCLHVCYRLAGSTSWTVARPKTMTSVSNTCPMQDLYVSLYDLRFQLPFSAAIKAQETLTISLSSSLPTGLKLVRMSDACAVSFCATGPSSNEGGGVRYVTACEVEQNPADFTSFMGGKSAHIMIGAGEIEYILCATNNHDAYIPVLQFGREETSVAFDFKGSKKNPELKKFMPAEWRVGFASMQTEFQGTDLNSGSDTVQAVLGTELLSTSPHVCPSPGAILKTALTSNMIPDASTTVTKVKYRRSDLLKENDKVHFCYVWGNNARTTYTGSIIMKPRVPLGLTISEAPATGYRAGIPISMTFSSPTIKLQPSTDKLFFYRFQNLLGSQITCFCGAECPESSLVKYDKIPLQERKGSEGNEILWSNPQGFDNYNYKSIYVICYNVTDLTSSTYMGQINVGMAEPTYYTATNAGGSNRVGYPINLKVTQLCAVRNCLKLSEKDDLMLAPVSLHCNDLNENDVNAKEQNLYEKISAPIIDDNGVSYTQRIVVNKLGEYRVCYRLETFYEELTSSLTNAPPVPLVIIAADPLSFVSLPATPSSGEFITMQLVCSNNRCRSCTLLRLVPGEMSSCWAEAEDDNIFTSDTCRTVTEVEFPNQYLPKGRYTACYGTPVKDSRRIPGTLLVEDSNPVSYTSSSEDICTNQYSDVTLTLQGSGLTAEDEIFLLTTKGFTCHDLRTNELQSNGTLSAWFKPSTSPAPLTVDAAGKTATWVASNRERRFAAGLLLDENLCDNPGEYCTLQLCYKRKGRTWSPVVIKKPQNLRLLPSNPNRAFFDKFPLAVGMYASVTVFGRGLDAADVLAVRRTTCAGEAVSIPVGSSLVNDAGTEWYGVLRFTAASAENYAVCYTRGTSTTEIATIDAAGNPLLIILGELYFLYNSANFTSTHVLSLYEEIMVAAAFSTELSTDLTSVQLIHGNTECNYIPFYGAHHIEPEFPTIMKLHPFPHGSSVYFADRLVNLNSPSSGGGGGGGGKNNNNNFALCMQVDVGLFRVYRNMQGGLLTITPPNPVEYTSKPNIPFPDQSFTLSFSLLNDNVDGGADEENLSIVQIIEGTLYDCGFRNTTIIGEFIIDQFSPSSLNLNSSPVSSGVITTTTTNNKNNEKRSFAGIIPDISLPKSYLGKKLTICYKRPGGSFATVPRRMRTNAGNTGGGELIIDQNFYIMDQTPNTWSAVPLQPQASQPLQITFLGDEKNPDFLQVKDRAVLKLVKGGEEEPQCEQAGENYKEGDIVSVGNLDKVGINTVWTIPPESTKVGVYIVCYTSVNNGVPIQVRKPLYLTIYPLQSPKGFFKYQGNSLDIFSGERFYLMFDTDVQLNPVLSYSQADAGTGGDGKDFVLFSTDSKCTAPLTESEVVVIPDSFHYEELKVLNPSGIITPYLHVVIVTAPKDLYVCMKRSNRHKGESFYTYEAIGNVLRPTVLRVTSAPITSYASTPEKPRAWVPFIGITPSYDSTYTITSFVRLFFTKIQPPGRVTGIINNCYRPTKEEAGISSPKDDGSIILLDTSLGIDLKTLFTLLPFPDAGDYQLCFQLVGNFQHSASVHATALQVYNPSPTEYTVSDVILTGEVFNMFFTALDGIFSVNNVGNKADIFIASDSIVSGKITPDCKSDTSSPAGGSTSFNTFNIISSTYASVKPQIEKKGYYYVCFHVYDQTSSFPVPNSKGGFIFSVGLIGPENYVVRPSLPYMGDQVEITIFGYLLNVADRVKIVDITGIKGEETGGNHSALCTAKAKNADAEISEGGTETTEGSVVKIISTSKAEYFPRVNTSGLFILCYKSVYLEDNAWMWISNLADFTVGSPHPEMYAVKPIPVYMTEIGRLTIFDNPSTHLLSGNDGIKLVTRGSGKFGFDCNNHIDMDTNIKLLQRVDAESTDTKALYYMCSTAPIEVTVCYSLEADVWAEVPLQKPPPTYVFSAVKFLSNPFKILTMSPSSPRPYENFILSFESHGENAGNKDVGGGGKTFVIKMLNFSSYPQELCILEPKYITPVSIVKNDDSGGGGENINSFNITLPFSGKYQIYIEFHSENDEEDKTQESLIAHSKPIEISPCDPCGFLPTSSFLNQQVSIKFQSRSGDSLSIHDKIRLIPMSQGVAGNPCLSPQGPFASMTYTPDKASSSSAETVFNVFTGATKDFLGDYYICYHKGKKDGSGGDESYAIVVSDNDELLTFSIYPALSLDVTACKSSPSFLEMLTLNLSYAKETYPKFGFSKGDVFFLVPPSVTCDNVYSNGGGGGGGKDSSGVLYPVLNIIEEAKNLSSWLLKLPGGQEIMEYTFCFYVAKDETAKLIDPPEITINPQNPSFIRTDPVIVTKDMQKFTVFIHGNKLTADDEVFIVDSAAKCYETCNEKLSPTQIESIKYTKKHVSETLMKLDFTEMNSGSSGAGAFFVICYRRFNSLLIPFINFVIGNDNPKKYEVNFNPRVGTRPTLTFTGHDLTKADRIILLPEGVYCDEALAAARGILLDVSTDNKQTKFYLPLVGENIIEDSYSVCYFVNNSLGYVMMPQALVIDAGGPTQYTSSNIPMKGRATVISFIYASYVSHAEDQAMIACANCNCWDNSHAELPYGLSEVAATKNNEEIKLRVGMDDVASYYVCYRVYDSGYAQVGDAPIIPVENSPYSFTMFPEPTYQGQRLVVNIKNREQIDTNKNKNNNNNFIPSLEDTVMLVNVKRLCWDTVQLSTDGILSSPSKVSDVVSATKEVTWKGHVPSLGPGTPPVSEFPAEFLLCYRESRQDEFLLVPYPPDASTMLPANPSTFTTIPESVSSGMTRVSMTFPTPAEGDTAFIVSFWGDKLLINDACDNTTSTIVTTARTSFPVYLFSLPPLLSVDSLVVCYTRVGGTVAEVPKLLPLITPNPSGYTVNTQNHDNNARQRQYLVFTFSGVQLKTAGDAVVFTETPCSEATVWPPVSTSFLKRLGTLSPNPDASKETSVMVTAQFIGKNKNPANGDDDYSIHVCYYYSSSKVWIETGVPLVFSAPVPTSVNFIPPIGSARVGQHIRIQIEGNDKMKLIDAGIISADNSNRESWCQNFTKANVQEPLLKIESSVLLDVPIWKTLGPARICIHNENNPWSDVSLTSTGSVNDVIIKEASPSSMKTFPSQPRVGQRVTLTLHVLETPTEKDKIKITHPKENAACELLDFIPEFPHEMNVVPDVDSMTSTIVLRDSTDNPYKYRSFGTAGNYQVCYYSDLVKVWSLVGSGSIATSTIKVSPLVPDKWSTLNDVQPTFARPFVLVFEDTLGSDLDPLKDKIWTVPSTEACDIDLTTCTTCMSIKIDTNNGGRTKVVSTPTTYLVVGKFNICYQLADATAAQLLVPLEVVEGDIKCVEQATVRIGQQQDITLLKKPDVDVAGDSLRISFFDMDVSHCGDNYVPDFVEGRAKLAESDSTTATYSFEWPVSMTMSKYRICYRHHNIVQPVCTCEQMESQSGECYISTLQPSPLWFVPEPTPTYVGEMIQLKFSLDTTMTQYPITAVKLVKYVNLLTVCMDKEAFPIEGGKLTEESPTLYKFDFKHNYLDGPGEYIVCTLSLALSPKYSRVGAVNAAKSTNTLLIRPFMSLTVFPESPEFLRAMQTLFLTFTHESSEEDDVVGLGDRIAFVSNPTQCNESTIVGMPSSTVMELFMKDDTSFSVVPAAVIDPSNKTRSSHVFVTFDANKGVGNHYICYKLYTGTWAPIATPLDIRSSLVTDCIKPLKNDGSGNNAIMRAMQYVQLVIEGIDKISPLISPTDMIKVVPQTIPCILADSQGGGGLFSSGVSIKDATNINLIAFTPKEGTYKVCYHFSQVPDDDINGISSWSPMCSQLTFTSPSPLGVITSGCLRVGQTLTIKAQQEATLQFSLLDTFRIVPGPDQCLYADGRETVSSTIAINDKVQRVEGTPVTAAGTTFTLPFIFLGTGTTSLRLCYKDSAGRQFAVPLNPDNLEESQFTVNPRDIMSVKMQSVITSGQRVVMKFISEGAPGTGRGNLVPYGAIPPVPFLPGPIYDGTFDAANGIHLSGSVAYREGRCYVLNPPLYGVYGTNTETEGSFDPKQGGMYVACYRPVGCNVEDIGSVFKVGEYNPDKFNFVQTPPRRGQLLQILFFRNTQDAESALLSPNNDRAMAQVDLSSCWSLPSDGGLVVQGTTEETNIRNVFFPAQAPKVSSVSQMRVCYHLQRGSWSELPKNLLFLQPANPVSFSVVNPPARIMQLNYIQFQGTSFSVKDRVKIIKYSNACTDDSKPPVEIVSYSGRGAEIPGTQFGWELINVTDTRSILKMGSTIKGNFSVCYKLGTDTVWTLVYGNLSILERDPTEVIQTPANVVEGELFTLQFMGSSSGTSLSETDRIALYTGVMSCLAPEKDADVIVTSPSRSDLLPETLFFQLAAGTRGSHTLCYLKANGDVIIWGFETIMVGANPWEYIIWPNLTSPPSSSLPLRINQLVSYIFFGFGLVSDTEAGKVDKVKLIPSSLATTDTSCQVEESAANMMYYPLIANGTHSLQVIRFSSSPAASGNSYWVCYKLNGGQFHFMEGSPIVLNPADPSCAISTKKEKILWDYEMDTWTIQSSENAALNQGYVFYSVKLCNDFLYYVSVLPDEKNFPYGVAPVHNGVASLRSGQSTGDNGDELTVSVCYYKENGRITMLSESSIGIVKGVPPFISQPISVKAMEIFQFELAVVPTPLDYLVLVENPDDCVGLTPPVSTDDVFMHVDNTAGDHIVATTSVGKEGTFHICYSHRVGRCGEASTKECARIVGRIEASAANPSHWVMTPQTVYATDHVEIELLRPLGAAIPSGEKLWLTPVLVGGEETKGKARARSGVEKDGEFSMESVAVACMNTIKDGNRIDLTLKPGLTDVWTTQLNVVKSYALCYAYDGAAFPTIFPPASRAGLTVHLTNVTSVTFTSQPRVDVVSRVTLHGGGLSQDDVVVAVGVPPSVGSDDAVIPADVCTNEKYTPRVQAEKLDAGYGLRVITQRFLFKDTGSYVLCFRAKVSTGPMVQITSDAFDVNPTILWFVVRSAALIHTPIEIEFHGNGLSVDDEAALIYSPSSSSVDDKICASGVYSPMKSAAEDGRTSLYVTTPEKVGNHVVCYRKPGLSQVLLPNTIEVTKRSAVGAKFTVIPVCSALDVCSPQPTVTLVNSEGEATSDPMATVVMRLKLTNGTYVDELLTGGSVYTEKNYSVFSFFVITISIPGKYIMEAKFTLRGGATLVASLPDFTVTDSVEQQGMVGVKCEPVGIIKRLSVGSSQSNPNGKITCLIQTYSSLAPTSYTVQLNAGKSTAVVPITTGSNGLPQYTFTVDPPHDQPLIQYVSITTQAAPPYESWPVMNSPVIVRIGSFPEEISTLSCLADPAEGLPPSLVRVYTLLTCHAQGKRIINGMEVNIVALPQYMQIISQYNGDVTTNKPVNIGDYPERLDGEYVFNVNISQMSRTWRVIGSVPLSEVSNVFVPMRGSPAQFTVIGEPQPDQTTISCASTRTGSTLWFTPVEPFLCTLSLRAEGQPINGIPRDFLITMPKGGSTEPISDDTWGPTLLIKGAAPPPFSSSSSSSLSSNTTKVESQALAAGTANSMNASMASSAVVLLTDQLFTVRVTFIPRSRFITSTTGTLVYATSISITDEGNSGGDVLLLALAGSGLSPANRYGIRSSSDCEAGVENEAKVTGLSASSTQIKLHVQSVGGPFYICFAPSDQKQHWQLLSNKVFNYELGQRKGLDKWTVLLIVGVILLFFLFLLLIVLIWRLWMYNRREEAHNLQKAAVYMPPRANYRFLRRNGKEQSSALSPFSTPSAPLTESSTTHVTPPVHEKRKDISIKRDDARIRMNIHDVDTYSDDVVIKKKCKSRTTRQKYSVPTVETRNPYTKQKHYEERSTETDENTYSDMSGGENTRFIPSVPPPQPPRVEDMPPLIGSVGEAREVSGRDGEEATPSGPYQHLHHPNQPSPVPLPPATTSSQQEREQTAGLLGEAQFSSSPSPAGIAGPVRTGEGGNNEDTQWAGPFVVRGHTSRPMVGPRPFSSGTRGKRNDSTEGRN